MALYQAGENLTLEFDKVTILYHGRQIFFGKVPDAKTYFEDLGFICKPRQTTADFLTAITDPLVRRVRTGWGDSGAEDSGGLCPSLEEQLSLCPTQEGDAELR